MKRLQGGAASETQQSQNLSSKPNISPQKKLLPYNEKIPFFFLLTGNSRISPPARKGQCLPSCHTHPPDRFNGLFFFFFLLLTHRIFINFLVSINPAACYFWGGEEERRSLSPFSGF